MFASSHSGNTNTPLPSPLPAGDVLTGGKRVLCFCSALLLLLALSLLFSCSSSGSGTTPSQPASPSPQVEAQAIDELIRLYRTAVLQSDIDRLQEVLGDASIPPGVQRQERAQFQSGSVGCTDVQPFLNAMSTAFRTRIITALDFQNMQAADDRSQIEFLETESIEDPTTLAQQTSLFRTTLRLSRHEVNGVVTFRISAVCREGPLAQVITPGQVQAGVLARVEGAVMPPLTLAGVESPRTGVMATRTMDNTRFHSVLMPPIQTPPPSLLVHLRGAAGEVMTFRHSYRLRMPGERVVQRIDGVEDTSFFAVAVAPDGTVWAGGDGGARLYQVLPGDTRAMFAGSLLEGQSAGRIEDLAFDSLGRLHAIVFAPQASGDIVFDRGVFCQTVNVLDASYPFQLFNPTTRKTGPSPSTRVTAASAGDVWLFGSDDGVARVADTFRQGQCSANGVGVTHDPIFRREESGLLSNTVPALVVGTDGALWVGTALGLTRLRNGQVTPVLFNDRPPSLIGNAATLEEFFQEVAAAIFAARPLTTVRLGGESFLEMFGRPLVKEDLIFSAVEGKQSQFWAGTLGGGLRRIEARAGTLQDTLHLTHAEVAHTDSGIRTVLAHQGLGSNLVRALAVGPDGAIWAATDKGVDRVYVVEDTVTITPFSALDGLMLPVRDVVVRADDTVWLGTGGGLFRLLPAGQGSTITGVVRDADGQPVADADVLVLGTPFRTVTNSIGQYTLQGLPPGQRLLRFDGRLAMGGPFTAAFQPALVRLAPRVPVVPDSCVTFSNAPGAQLCLPSGTVQFPTDESPSIGLTLLPLTHLPLPLPPGAMAVAAADVQPSGTRFTTPASLTLPNTGKLPAGSFVNLFRLNEGPDPCHNGALPPCYDDVGLGRVGDNDDTIITTLPGSGLLGLSTLVFATTNVVQLVKVSGDQQTGTVGKPLPASVVVQVQDSQGGGIPDVQVTFTGENCLPTDSDVTTDPNGRAATGVTLGPQAGECRVGAHASGLDLVFFTATVLPPRLRIVSGNNQIGRPGEELSAPLVVRLEDQLDAEPLDGEEVTARIIEGRAQFVGGGTTATVRSHDGGIAEFRLRLEPEEQCAVVVEIAALNAAPVQFNIAVNFSIAPTGWDIAVNPIDGSLVLLDAALLALVDIDPVSGIGTVLSGCKDISCSEDIGGGAFFFPPGGIAIETERFLVVALGITTSVLRVDRQQNGFRSVVSGCLDLELPCSQDNENPPFFVSPSAIVVETAGVYFVVDSGLRAIVKVVKKDDDTPDTRTVISGCEVPDNPCPPSSLRGTGRPFAFPKALALLADGSFVVVDEEITDTSRDRPGRALVHVDRDGNRTIVSGCMDELCSVVKGSGLLFTSPEAVAIQADGSFLVVDDSRRAVIHVTAEGDRTVVSGCIDETCSAMRGSGPPFGSPEAIAVETPDSLVVVDAQFAAVMRIDRQSGERRLVSCRR